ncbi:hypothetical protein [uncultured Mediterranean phage]|nr:hypothetical protein [uncultured Mediterranean phage]
MDKLNDMKEKLIVLRNNILLRMNKCTTNETYIELEKTYKRISAIIVVLLLISINANAQIEIPLSNRTADIYLQDTNIVLGTLPANTGEIDSFGYVTTRFPTFVAEDGYVTYIQINNLWDNRQYQNNEYVVDTLVYKPDNTKWFAALRNRKGIAMFQKVRVYEREYAEKTLPEQFWWLYEYMIDNSINNDTFWNSQQVVDIITPVEIPPIDTTE